MIDYREDWLILLVFRLKGSVTLRALLFALPSSLLSLVLVIVDDVIPDFREHLGILELNKSQMWSACTAVLGILLGFRTNRAMARFWEGTGLLHQMRAEWFDSVSCCCTFSRASLEAKKDGVMRFRHTLVRLMSLCHGSALEEIAGDVTDGIDTIDAYGLDDDTLQHLKDCKDNLKFNRVEVLLHMMQTLIMKALDDGVLKVPPPILSRVFQTLSRGFVNLLNAKKIADTRFPFPFAQILTMLLFMNVLMTPLMLSALINSKIWAPIFTFVPIFAICYLNFVGIELENPFGNDDNDLPLEHFQSEMNNCLLMLLHGKADTVAGISDDRCVMDFTTLHESLAADHDMAEGDEMTPSNSLEFGEARSMSRARISTFSMAQVNENIRKSTRKSKHSNTNLADIGEVLSQEKVIVQEKEHAQHIQEPEVPEFLEQPARLEAKDPEPLAPSHPREHSLQIASQAAESENREVEATRQIEVAANAVATVEAAFPEMQSSQGSRSVSRAADFPYPYDLEGGMPGRSEPQFDPYQPSQKEARTGSRGLEAALFLCSMESCSEPAQPPMVTVQTMPKARSIYSQRGLQVNDYSRESTSNVIYAR